MSSSCGYELALAEINRISWHEYRIVMGNADHVPAVLRNLLLAVSVDAVQECFDWLEDFVFQSTNLLSSAEPVVSVLMAALLEEPPIYIRCAILEVIFWIAKGLTDRLEVDLGNADLAERCRQRAREGLWLLYRETEGELYKQALEILDIVELNRERLASAIERVNARLKSARFSG